MGLVKTTKQSNDSYLLEITYGGAEAPFGGIDTSAPPAYIDPKCFVDADGFLVADNQITAVSLQQVQMPILFNGTLGISILGMGTFFNSTFGQLNYVLGYIATPITSAPTGVAYTFYITSWNPSNSTITHNDILPITLFDSFITAIPATITLDVIQSQTGTNTQASGVTVNINTVNGTGGITNITLSGGTGYSGGMYLSIISGGGEGGVVQIAGVTPGGAVLSYNILYAGAAYPTGAATAGITFPSELVLFISSLGITASITSIGGAGQVTGVSVTGGSGFSVGQYLNVVQVGTVTLSPAIIEIASVSGTGAILTTTIPTAGSGYSLGAIQVGFMVPVPSTPSANTYKSIISATVTAVNNAGITVMASASVDGYQLILTAVPGIVGNSITVQDMSFNQNAGLAPVFYFSCRTPRVLEQGVAQVSVNVPRTFTQASIAEVGGTVYIGNLGPMILSYAGPGAFTTSTLYTGVNVLRKFAGSLVGLGVVPQVGIFTQDTDMIFAWSASTQLNEWAPVTASGNVTGAGFAQLADISDALVGLIVSNNTAFILRQQGVSYATSTGNGTSPYSFAHISLGDSGEGAQNAALVAQYDQMGCYVGNSNIYGCSQGPSPVGDKIKNAIFTFLGSLPDPIPSATATAYEYLITSGACAMNLGGTADVYFAFMFSNIIYIFNGVNQTWMKFSYINQAFPLQLVKALLAPLGNSSLQSTNQAFKQDTLSLLLGIYNANTLNFVSPLIYSFVEGIAAPSAPGLSNLPYVQFPEEEIMFGRDITIDAIYISINAQIPNGALTLTFSFSGITFTSVTLSAAMFPSAEANPLQMQVFGSAGSITLQAPQLKITVANSSTVNCLLRINKITVFGSFDPNQRPV